MILILSECSRGLSRQAVWLRAERKIATETRGVLTLLLRVRALIGYASWRLFKFKTGESILSGPLACIPRFRDYLPSLFPLPSLSLFPFRYPTFSYFPSFVARRPPPPPTRSFLAPLIPASCRSSLRPARSSKNSLTCLGVAYLFLLYPLFLHSPPGYLVCTMLKRRSIGKLVAAMRRSPECFERKEKSIFRGSQLGRNQAVTALF